MPKTKTEREKNEVFSVQEAFFMQNSSKLRLRMWQSSSNYHAVKTENLRSLYGLGTFWVCCSSQNSTFNIIYWDFSVTYVGLLWKDLLVNVVCFKPMADLRQHSLGLLDANQVVGADWPLHSNFTQVLVLVLTESGDGLRIFKKNKSQANIGLQQNQPFSLTVNRKH